MRQTIVEYNSTVVILVIHEFEGTARHRLTILDMSFCGLVFLCMQFKLQILIIVTK